MNQIEVFNSQMPSQQEMLVLQTVASYAASSKMYRNVGDEAGILMIMLAAKELHIPVVQALNGGINIIQGKVELSARMMNSLMRRAGITIAIVESTDERCELIGTRQDGDTAKVSYSLGEAQKAGLVKPAGGWVKNPRDMCFARAISRLARQLAPDIIGGCYVEGEISDSKPIAPESLPQAEVYQEDSALQEKLMSLFEPQDEELLIEYTDVVMKHFSWNKNKVIAEFLRDEKSLKEKFELWKAKKMQR